MEQLESLPVFMNGGPSVHNSSHPPPPPENEDDHIESGNGFVHNDDIAAASSEDDEDNVNTNGGMLENSVGMPLNEFVEHVRVKGRKGLYDEYAEIKARAPTGTFNHARSLENSAKNRYTDVLCYDHSRVILDAEANESGSDYINANFVDGYCQKRAFIFSQVKIELKSLCLTQECTENSMALILCDFFYRAHCLEPFQIFGSSSGSKRSW